MTSTGTCGGMVLGRRKAFGRATLRATDRETRRGTLVTYVLWLSMTTPDDLRAALGAQDLYDPGHAADPYPFYAEARRGAPVFFNASANSWFVTRPEDVLTVLRDTERFSSKYLMSPRTPLAPEIVALLGDPDARLPTMLTTDPPDHTRLRGLVNKGFSPQRVAAMEPQLRVIAR